jgi:hypothetical protein
MQGKGKKSTNEVKNLIGSNKMTSGKKKTMIVNIVNYKIKSDYDNLHKKNACRKSNEA